MELSAHRVEDLEMSEIRQQDKTGSYVRDVKIEGRDNSLEVTLFSDDKEDLQFEV